MLYARVSPNVCAYSFYSALYLLILHIYLNGSFLKELEMIKNLIKIANKLDQMGLNEEADLIDSYVRSLLDKKLKDYTYNWNVRWNDDGEESFHSESDVENED